MHSVFYGFELVEASPREESDDGYGYGFLYFDRRSKIPLHNG